MSARKFANTKIETLLDGTEMAQREQVYGFPRETNTVMSSVME